MISKHFSLNEFVCPCCKYIPPPMPPKSLVGILEEIREHFNAPVIINSAYRCPAHNAKVGGSKKSRHMTGDAVDIVVKGIKTEEVWAYVLKSFGSLELGLARKRNKNNPFGGFIHIDTRGEKARWEYK